MIEQLPLRLDTTCRPTVEPPPGAVPVGPLELCALEPGAHQMSAVVDLAVAVLESDAATSAHKELVAR